MEGGKRQEKPTSVKSQFRVFSLSRTQNPGKKHIFEQSPKGHIGAVSNLIHKEELRRLFNQNQEKHQHPQGSCQSLLHESKFP